MSDRDGDETDIGSPTWMNGTKTNFQARYDAAEPGPLLIQLRTVEAGKRLRCHDCPQAVFPYSWHHSLWRNYWEAAKRQVFSFCVPHFSRLRRPGDAND